MNEKKFRALIVDDEKIIRDFLNSLLSLHGLEVVKAEDGYQAIELSRTGRFDLFFIDCRLPGLNGLETFRQIRQIDQDASVVMMTGYAVEGIPEQAVSEGAYGLVRKPFDIGEIKCLIDKILVEKKK